MCGYNGYEMEENGAGTLAAWEDDRAQALEKDRAKAFILKWKGDTSCE